MSELERLRSTVATLAQNRDLELKRLREQVALLQGDSTRASEVGSCPLHARFDPGELAQWMEDRQADLHEALSLDDTNRILELTCGDERWHVAVTRQ